jgi:hypothetical protein
MQTLSPNINHDAKQRTVCSQEGENDEDIINSNSTILMVFEQKVNQFSIKITFDTFDESMLHHVCSFSFSELLFFEKTEGSPLTDFFQNYLHGSRKDLVHIDGMPDQRS